MSSIKYFSKNLSETSGSSRWFATDGDMEFSAIKEMGLQSNQKVKYDNYTPPEKGSDEYEVEVVATKSKLEKGYNAEGTGPLVDGLIFGGAYVFEATLFKNGKIPTDFSTIKWAYSYEGENGKVEGDLDGHTGKKIGVSLLDPGLCGRNLTIYAYINSKESGGSVTTWVHYRFRYFSRQDIKNELAERLKRNYLIDQNNTSLCGMAAIYYVFLRVAPADFEKIALELHQKGEIKLNNYTIKPASSMYEMAPLAENEDYPAIREYSSGTKLKVPLLMPKVDWIVLASTRSSESNLGYSGKSGETVSAINWGSVMLKLMKELMGYTTIIDNTAISTIDKYPEILTTMQEEYNQGYQIIMLINSNMLSKKDSWINLTNWHYIVFEGNLCIDEKMKECSFNYFSWGKLVPADTFSKAVFNSNFYGYYKIKK
ncbi:hypothetical protein HDE68_001260 [Pedobacter cryoconitis]|uniref:Uncharacterized protein n=1 Tax=Pedobacter cryoconitis TaxID=188932 RepID=A0A7W8ZK68_9SPHI|nr:hypothetical protein [Pedobacter cryoconitis]MBB5635372.1 hypothetical protein [Pedobacter cryoconitis]